MGVAVSLCPVGFRTPWLASDIKSAHILFYKTSSTKPMRLFYMTTILLTLSIIVKAQDISLPFPTTPDGYGYTEIVQVDSSCKKDDLYKNAKLYFVDAYKSAKDVIQYDERSDAKVIGKGLFNVTEIYDAFLAVSTYEWSVYFNTEITCKDGKYKYRIYDIKISQTITGSKYGPTETSLNIDQAKKLTTQWGVKKISTKLLNKTIKQFDATINQLKYYMAKRPNKTKDDF